MLTTVYLQAWVLECPTQSRTRATMTRGYPSSDAATVNPSDTIPVFISNSSGDEYCDGNREDASICA